MKQSEKKLTRIITTLVLVTVILLFCAAACAKYTSQITLPEITLNVSTGIEYIDFMVTTDNRDMIGYTDTTTELAIPATFQSAREYDADGDGTAEPIGTWYKVTGISNGTIYANSNLVSITIPESVSQIDTFAIFACKNLANYFVDEKSEYFCSEDGVLYDKNMSTVISHPQGRNNTSYVIPDSVTTIRENAFYDCETLTSISISDSVTTIGTGAFMSCNGLTSLTIPNSVVNIGSSAFNGCTSVTSIYLGSGIVSIGNRAFGACHALTDVYYEGTEANWNAIEGISNAGFTDSKVPTIHYNSAG